MSINCVSWTEAFPVAYPCNSDDRHMPWEACEWAGQPDGPRHEIGYQTKTVCMSGGGGGEGSGNGNNQGGGGGNTIPNTPYGYEPCDQPPGRPNPDVPPCEEPTMAENLISLLGLNETEHQSQIDFLMNPTRNLLVQQMNSYLWVNEGSLESQEFLRWVVAYLSTPGGSTEEVIATHISLVASVSNFSTSDYNSHYNSISSYLPNAQTITPQIYAVHFTMQCAIIKAQNPEYPTWRVYWEASKEMVHLLLDGVGLVPGIGEIADLTNGLIYTIEGDGVNATLSYASAIPFVGWAATAGKYAKKTITLTNGSKTTLKWVMKAGDIVNFGDRTQLRKILNLAPGDPRQAHHIIPWGKQAHPAIQKAAKRDGLTPFHMNEALNGIPLNNSAHLGSHNHYDNLVQQYLDAIPTNATPQQAYDAINNLIGNIRTAIQNNPNTHINQLIF